MLNSSDIFGAPLLTRKSEISTKLETAQTFFPLEVMGKYQRLKQITVRIGLPVYRIENGRTRTFQKEYLATHPDAPSDLFVSDPESLQAQRAQHEILWKLAVDEDLLKEFQSGTQQTEPVIITSNGVVVNGNRRLCVWRWLFMNDPEKYKYFEFVDVAVLPDDCDEPEIKALEKRLQIQKTHRAEYKWHNKAAMMKEERDAGDSPEQLAKSYDISKKDVDVLIGALEYADMYLRKIGKTDQWSLVDGDEFAFKSMVEERKKITEQGRKELFETVCFRLIKEKDYQGRLYSGIPDIAANLDAIAAALQENGLSSKDEETANDAPALEPGSNPSRQDDEDIDLLGGEYTPPDKYSELANAVQTSPVKLGELVKRVTEEQKAIESEQKSSKYLIDKLSSISRLLWNIRKNGLHEHTALKGARTHLVTIQGHLDVIRKWIDEHDGE